jgi:ferredoxin
MRIHVDLNVCQGHGQCEDVAPDLFEVRDDGYAHVLVDEVLNPDARARAQQAARRCPTEAIELV